MPIWSKHPNYTDDELRTLVKAAAFVLVDGAEGGEAVDPDILETGERSIAKELARSLGTPSERVEAFLGKEPLVREASIAVLDEIRQSPDLAAAVAEAYEEQRRKMVGAETLLAGALLVLAIRVAKVRLPANIQIDFFRVNSAAKGLLSNMLAGLK